MSWFKRYLLASRKIYVPEKDLNLLYKLVDKITKGHRNWTLEELQLQQNYPEALEVLLGEKA